MPPPGPPAQLCGPQSSRGAMCGWGASPACQRLGLELGLCCAPSAPPHLQAVPRVVLVRFALRLGVACLWDMFMPRGGGGFVAAGRGVSLCGQGWRRQVLLRQTPETGFLARKLLSQLLSPARPQAGEQRSPGPTLQGWVTWGVRSPRSLERVTRVFADWCGGGQRGGAPPSQMAVALQGREVAVFGSKDGNPSGCVWERPLPSGLQLSRSPPAQLLLRDSPRGARLGVWTHTPLTVPRPLRSMLLPCPPPRRLCLAMA